MEAITRGKKVNETRLLAKFRAAHGTTDREDIYHQLGMQYIPPSCVKTKGEIEALSPENFPKI